MHAMNIKKVLFAPIFLALFVIQVQQAEAFGDPRRYFVRTSSSIIRHAVGNIRYDFDMGFSADLTSFQIKLARMFGGEVVELRPMYISQDGVAQSFSGATVAHQTGIAGGENITVAVLDTGIASHPDLDDNIIGCKDFTLSRPSTDTCVDRNGHGTHVAGILVSQASDVSVRVYKVCADSGVCFPDDVASAISAALKDKNNIILMGFGAERPSELIAAAIAAGVKTGTVFIAAAGNGGPYDDSVEYPGAFPGVISVGALDQRGNLAEWSSRPATILAVGDRVDSTWLEESYKVLSGTSMAAPYIAGRTARMLSDREK